jgi:short-subunit dehydrogenase
MRTAYSASKFAFTGFSRALRGEVSHHGVKVTMIYPGYVQTNISKNAHAGAFGQTIGFTDKNIANGIALPNAISRILRAVETGETEYCLYNGID